MQVASPPILLIKIFSLSEVAKAFSKKGELETAFSIANTIHSDQLEYKYSILVEVVKYLTAKGELEKALSIASAIPSSYKRVKILKSQAITEIGVAFAKKNKLDKALTLAKHAIGTHKAIILEQITTSCSLAASCDFSKLLTFINGIHSLQNKREAWKKVIMGFMQRGCMRKAFEIAHKSKEKSLVLRNIVEILIKKNQNDSSRIFHILKQAIQIAEKIPETSEKTIDHKAAALKQIAIAFEKKRYFYEAFQTINKIPTYSRINVFHKRVASYKSAILARITIPLAEEGYFCEAHHAANTILHPSTKANALDAVAKIEQEKITFQ